MWFSNWLGRRKARWVWPHEAPDGVVRLTSYKRWIAKIGEAVPLRYVSLALKIPTQDVVRGVRDGVFRVHEFRAIDGRVFRMVPVCDLKSYRGNALKDVDTAAMLRRVMRHWMQ